MEPSVVALLSTASKNRLLKAMPELSCVDDCAQLEARIEENPSAVAIIEHGVLTGQVNALERLRRRFPSANLLLYLRLDPKTIRGSLESIQVGATDVVFAEFDDSRERLDQLIATAKKKGHRVRVASRHFEVLNQLPPELRVAAETMIRCPERFHTTSDLARAAGMSTRSVFRSLKRCGVRSGRRLIAAARVLVAYELLCEGRRSAQQVAQQIGYTSVEQLSAHLSELANCRCRDIRRGISQDAFCAAVARSLRVTPVESTELAGAP